MSNLNQMLKTQFPTFSQKKNIMNLGVIALVVAGIAVGASLVQQNQDIRYAAAGPQAPVVIYRQANDLLDENTEPEASLQELTANLMTAAQRLAESPQGVQSAQRDLVSSLVQERQQALFRLMYNQPEEVATYQFPASLRAKMPPEIRAMIEEKQQLRGEFLWEHSDDFDMEVAKDDYSLKETGSNKTYRLHFPANRPPQSPSGSRVAVEAYVLGDTAVVTDMTTQALPEANASLVASKKIAVILVNFTGLNSQPWTVDQVRNTVFTGTGSVNAYYQETSFGQWQLGGKLRPDGDIFGWYTIPFDGSSCAESTIVSQARSAAQAEGVDLTGYDNVIYAWPRISSCSYAGKAVLCGYPGYAYINGSMNTRVVAHELGHNYCMWHASSYACLENNQPVSISDAANCTIGEYGDPFDIMGSSTYHFSNHYKGLSRNTTSSPRWLKPENTLTVDRVATPDSTYTVVPIEQESTQVQALRIPRDVSGGTISSYYYVEFRQPYGFDSFSPTSPVAMGVTIRLAPDYTVMQKTRLIDTNPSTTTFTDAPLAVGRTFTDPYTGINITTQAVSATGAQVRVSFGTTPCSNSAPILSVAPSSLTGSPGQSLTYRYTLTNSDGAGCGTSTYNMSATLPSGWSSSPTALPSETLSPGSSVSRDITILSPLTAPASSYTLTLRAQHSTNLALASTATMTYVVTVADITPPQVVINKPANYSQVPAKGNLQIQATASDNKQVTLIQLYMDAKLLTTCRSRTTCSAKVNAAKVTAGNHLIRAVATDAAGNTGMAEVTVVK